jgi:hypothetical protein
VSDNDPAPWESFLPLAHKILLAVKMKTNFAANKDKVAKLLAEECTAQAPTDCTRKTCKLSGEPIPSLATPQGTPHFSKNWQTP